MYLSWCVLVIKSTELNPEGENSFKCPLGEKKTIHKKKGNAVLLEIACCDKKKGMKKDNFVIPRECKSQKFCQHRRTEVKH